MELMTCDLNHYQLYFRPQFYGVNAPPPLFTMVTCTLTPIDRFPVATQMHSLTFDPICQGMYREGVGWNGHRVGPLSRRKAASAIAVLRRFCSFLDPSTAFYESKISTENSN